MDGVIFDIQYYAMYDGPGIRTCVFFKGCPLRCAWCHNPESWDPNIRMGYSAERCTGCGQCAEACPNNALQMLDGRVLRDIEKCSTCGACAEACPNKATEKIGRKISVEEIVRAVIRDKIFYDESGGGVTISGGEPTMRPDFLLDTLRALKETGIHIALETCGCFKEELLEELAGLVDLFLYDLKSVDSENHKRFTGVSNKLILSNFEKILALAGSEKITPRIPLIPGFNSDDASIDAIAGFLQEAGYSGEVHLMPYNRLAKIKWEKVGKGASYRDFGELSDKNIGYIASRFERAGFDVVCNR